MSVQIRMLPEPVFSLAAASVPASYSTTPNIVRSVSSPANVWPNAETRFPSVMILFQNLTDQTVMISLDGVHDHFPLAANTSFVQDVSTNRGVAQDRNVASGTGFWVKQVGVPSSGSVYVTSWFGGTPSMQIP